MIEIIGDWPDVERRPLGLWSFDRALGGGQPMRAVYEMFGPMQSGKTSLAQYMAARGSLPGKILFMEIENRLDKEYLRSNLELAGFDGKVVLIPRGRSKKKKWMGINHTECLNELAEGLLEDDVTAGILDSAGALVSEAQAKRKIGEQKPGDEAKLVWQLLRKVIYALNRGRMPDAPPANLYLISHTHGVIGGRGYTTSGGTAGEYLATVRLSMWPGDFEDDGSFTIKGTVQKLTYGPSKRKFKVFLLAGRGIHVGLTAMVDCVDLELAKRESRGVVLDGTNIGRIGTLLKAAREGKDAKFKPFFEALKEIK